MSGSVSILDSGANYGGGRGLGLGSQNGFSYG